MKKFLLFFVSQLKHLAENKLKSFYRLTEKGDDLKFILAKMLLRTDKYLEHNQKDWIEKARKL